MKNLHKLAAECRADLLSIGIQPSECVSFDVNTRAKKRWGQCTRTPGGYNISISARLLQDDVDDMAAKDTIVHELLHTIKGAMKHTGVWLRLANQVNAQLPQYNIKRITLAEEKGIAPVEPKYIVECPNCGKQYARHRMVNFVQNPQRYKCGVCGTTLKRVK